MPMLLEQFVYGSFPFWDRGYDVLARSPGCRPEWVAEALTACRQYGEAPSGVEPSPALFAIRLGRGPWGIVGVGPQGSDDRGRPGALAFHVLIVPDRDYRRAGSDPFGFSGALRRDWSAGTTLGPLPWSVEAPRQAVGPPGDTRARSIVTAMESGRRVALESAGPIDGLAREVWAGLPEKVRRRAAVATWAYGNANRFDLVAVPRLAGVALDRSYADPASLDNGPFAAPPALPLYRRLPQWGPPAASVVSLVAIGLGWRAMVGPREMTTRVDPPTGLPSVAPSPTIDAEERARIVGGLADLADRFEGFDVGDPSDPSGFLARFSDRLRYRGPILSPEEVARLSAESDPDRDRALAWHRRIGAFADDRALPADFADAPLSRQLVEVARSLGVEPPSGPGAILDALVGSLCRDGPVRPTPLAARYPALSDYARFLGRLPRCGNPADGR